MTWEAVRFFLLQGGILFFSAMICAAVGFGLGIFSNSLLLLAGMKLPEAIPISVTTLTTQSAASVYHLRAHFKFSRIALVLVLAMVFMPGGTALQYMLVNQLTKEELRAIVGAIILAVTLLQWGLRIQPRERVHWGWAVLAGSVGGVLGGLCGMGGPPIVLWVIAHQWTNRETRVALWTTFLSMVPMQFFLIALFFGADIVMRGILVGILATPFVAAGTVVGMKIGNRMSKHVLQVVARLLLIGIALAMILIWVVVDNGTPQ